MGSFLFANYADIDLLGAVFLSFFKFEIKIPPLISKNAIRYCSFQMFSPSMSAPKMQANTGSANLMMKSLDNSPFLTTPNQIQ